MKRLAILAVLGLSLVGFGCAGMQKPISKDTVVKCPKCGAEFTISEGLGPEHH